MLPASQVPLQPLECLLAPLACIMYAHHGACLAHQCAQLHLCAAAPMLDGSASSVSLHAAVGLHYECVTSASCEQHLLHTLQSNTMQATSLKVSHARRPALT